MALDAQLALFRKGHEAPLRRPVGVVTREAGKRLVGPGIHDAGPHWMRERGMSLMTVRAHLERFTSKQDGLVRAMGPVADGAATIARLFRMIGRRRPETLLDFVVAGETNTPFLAPQQTRDL